MLPTDPRAARRRAIALGIAFVWGVFPGAGILRAQDRERDRLLHEIETTQQMLESARGAIGGQHRPRLATELRFAFRMQDEARNLARTGTTRLQFRRAFDLTQRARFVAQRALDIVPPEADPQPRAQAMLGQLERDLEDARERARAHPTPGTARVLELAERQIEQARAALRENRTRQAIDTISETERLLETVGSPGPDPRLEEMLQNVRQLLERAEGENPDEDSTALLLRARELVQEAEALAPARPDAAATDLRQARELILRALQRSEPPLGGGDVDSALEETGTFVESVAVRIRRSGNADAAVLLDNSLRHLEQARSLRRADRLRQALEEARVSRNLARRAAAAAGTHP
jgi:hypothetical protein